MKTRTDRRRFRADWQAASLEARNLMDAGAAGAASAVLRDLGSVSRGAVLAGAAATASIDPGGAVTFRFTLEVGGDYTLRVRHDGDGLSLVALTPAGPATIDPGPAGPFRAVELELPAATYEVTATATAAAGRPVFVDWDLLLNSGVGQASASAASTTVLALAPPPSASAPDSPAAASDGSSPAAGSSTRAVVGEPPAQTLAYPLAGATMGRASLDAQAAPAPVAPAPDAPNFEATTVAVNLTGLIRPIGPTDLAAAAPGDAMVDGPESTRVAGAISISVPTSDRAEPAEAEDPEAEAWGPLDAIAPGLCIGAIGVAVDVRRRRLRGRALGLDASAPPRELVRRLVGRTGTPARIPPLSRPILPPLPDAAD